MPLTNSPRWPLSTIKALVADGSFRLSNSAVDREFGSRYEATAALVEIVAGLGLRSFSHQVQQDEVFDVYGVIWDGRPWYVKWAVVQKPTKLVLCISLHRPDRPLQTKGGIIK